MGVGPNRDGFPAAARNGRLVFAGEVERDTLVGLPMDANAARATGTLQPLRNDAARTSRATASEDGRLLVFPMLGFSGSEVWIRDLRSARERQLAVAPAGS